MHAQTVSVVDEQMKDLDEQMTSLDDFVAHARCQNAQHHDQHSESLQSLSKTVEGSYGSINSHFKETLSRVQGLGSDMDTAAREAQSALEPAAEGLREPLAELRQRITSTSLQEYQPTGETPRKTTYDYPTSLPQTKDHAKLIEEMHGASSPRGPAASGGLVYADADTTLRENRSPTHPGSSDEPAPADRDSLAMSLREVHPNISANTSVCDSRSSLASMVHGYSASLADTSVDTDGPLHKKSRTARSSLKGGLRAMGSVEGRENMPPTIPVVGSGSAGRAGEIFAQSVSRRKSPRLN